MSISHHPRRFLLPVFACVLLWAASGHAQPAPSHPPPPSTYDGPPGVSPDQELAAARAEAEQARKDAEATRKKADRAIKNTKIAKKQRDAAIKEAEEAKRNAKAAQDHVTQVEAREKAALAAKTAALAKAAKEAELQKKKLIWTAAGGGALVLLIAVTGLLLLRRSRRKRMSAEATAEQAVRATRPVPGAFDILLEGSDQNGGKVALKIPALALNPDTGGAVIGRNPNDANFVINYPELSRRHCRLFVRDGRLMLEDLQSTNGTFVNGEKLDSEPAELAERSIVGIAGLKLTLRRTQS